MYLTAVKYIAKKPGICTDLRLFQTQLFNFIVAE